MMSPLLDVRELRALAALPLQARWPHLSSLDGALRHRQREIRVLALAALAGATGHSALCALVSALDDPDPEIRAAALSSLWASARVQPARWAHALFHPRPEVRREAAGFPAPPSTAGWRLHLRSDPASAGSLPAPGLGELRAEHVLALHSQGALSDDEARRHLAAVDWREVRLGSRWEAALALFWSEPSPEASCFYGALALARPEPGELLQALQAAGARTGRWPDEAALLAALCEPRFLADGRVPLSVRRDAGRALLACDHDHALSHPQLGDLLDAIEREGCDPERVLAAMSLGDRWSRWCAQRRLDRAPMREAIRADPGAWAALLALGRGLTARWRVRLRAWMGEDLPLVYARLAYRLPPRLLGFLRRQGQDIPRIFEALLRLEPEHGPAGLAPVARALVEGLPGDGASQLLGIWLGQPHPERLLLGGAVLHELRRQRWKALADAVRRLGRRQLDRLVLALQWQPPADTHGLSELQSALQGGASLRGQGYRLVPVPACWPRPRRAAVRALTLAEGSRLAYASDLVDALGPALAGPSLGLTAPLGRRAARPHLGAALALLGCHDPAPRVHRELLRFLPQGAEAELTQLAMAHWRGLAALPALGHAWLADDPSHADLLGRALLADPRGLRHALAELLELPLLAERVRIGLASALYRWEQLDRSAFARASDPAVLALLKPPASAPAAHPEALAGTAPADEIVRAALMAGGSVVPEASLLPLVQAAPPDQRLRARELLLSEGLDEEVGSKLGQELRAQPLPERTALRGRLASVLAWGTRAGERLAGRRFTFHLLGDSALGYTRLGSDDIWVSPLGLLRGERHGRARLEGLILHEIGHHLYHSGPQAQATWAEAERLGLGSLFNLVADEHLERRLRALSPAYGDRLKRLAAHAFQHDQREFEVDELLGALGPRGAPALWRCRLRVARDPARVSVHSGRLLAELGRQGDALGRFVRALRMGLGHRDGDAAVSAALALFGRDFKALDMPGLLAVTRKLAELFDLGIETARLFGGHERTCPRGSWGALRGLTDEELQEELRKQLGEPVSPPRGEANQGPAAPICSRLTLERLPADPAAHAVLARQVSVEAARLRDFLQQLGHRQVPAPARLLGRRLDRGRLPALAAWGEPRVMSASQRIPEDGPRDLFVGVAIDCSSSMVGAPHTVARAFGVLLAEAASGLPQVDVALYGFTDRFLYDAGTAERCSVASLPCGGCNDDAAAFAYLAEVGRRSPRRTRLLVMVSDGLPSGCSVATLQQQVEALTREGFLCVHVAVAPLSAICFPHRLVVEGRDLLAAVARFGTTIARLVAQEQE